MGLDIYGWVEVHPESSSPSGDDTWHGVMTVHTLLTRHHDMMALLFGIRELPGFAPIVPQRGLPQNVSHEASSDYLACEGCAFGETWISSREIQAIAWSEPAIISNGQEPVTRQHTLETADSWQLLFDLMARLAKDYGDENVRFVAWFMG